MNPSIYWAPLTPGWAVQAHICVWPFSCISHHARCRRPISLRDSPVRPCVFPKLSTSNPTVPQKLWFPWESAVPCPNHLPRKEPHLALLRGGRGHCFIWGVHPERSDLIANVVPAVPSDAMLIEWLTWEILIYQRPRHNISLSNFPCYYYSGFAGNFLQLWPHSSRTPTVK